jgi:hypothetical protein
LTYIKCYVILVLSKERRTKEMTYTIYHTYEGYCGYEDEIIAKGLTEEEAQALVAQREAEEVEEYGEVIDQYSYEEDVEE